MFVDSHCHLDFPDLSERLDQVLAHMREAAVSHALCISVTLEDFPKVRALAEGHPQLFATVGVHPDNTGCAEPSMEELCRLAEHPRVVGIGETGLDYFRLTGDLEWQRERFRVHIRAARQSRLPLVIHTRAAAADTLRIMAEEGASEVGGVMHCFTESREVAQQALELGFHISLSGIVTFKNAADLREVAAMVPLERLLIETDSPYLAPVPFRGKTNEPAYVRHVAAMVAEVKNISIEDVGLITSRNFFELFSKCEACDAS
jgi:TatD DNase family protein